MNFESIYFSHEKKVIHRKIGCTVGLDADYKTDLLKDSASNEFETLFYFNKYKKIFYTIDDFARSYKYRLFGKDNIRYHAPIEVPTPYEYMKNCYCWDEIKYEYDSSTNTLFKLEDLSYQSTYIEDTVQDVLSKMGDYNFSLKKHNIKNIPQIEFPNYIILKIKIDVDISKYYSDIFSMCDFINRIVGFKYCLGLPIENCSIDILGKNQRIINVNLSEAIKNNFIF